MKRIYGRRPVEEFFRSKPDPSAVRRIYVSTSLPKKFMAILLPFMKGMKDRIEERPRAELDKICDGNHQGIVVEVTDAGALASVQAAGSLRRPDPARTIREALENHPGLYVLTDRIQDAQNLGSLIRSAEALGAMALIVTGKGVRPNEVSDRISAGGSQHLPVFIMANPDGLLRDAMDRQYWVLAAAGRPDDEHQSGAESLAAEPEEKYGSDYALEIDINDDGEHDEPDDEENGDDQAGSDEDGRAGQDELAGRRAKRSNETILAEFGRGRAKQISIAKGKGSGPVYLWTDEVDELPENGRYILMIGHEGEGLKRSLIERSDYVISIPMHGRLSSLNAAVAGAILIERILSVRPPLRYD